ncbi:N-acetylmuramoyl-L-alanine amidase [Heliophilum fasciatum]|uniref:N-acetylmuramoyl-L-alanine amidase n=1 Tax=Heliophilum fasciatum TaxID=35700 RepID=A0A4R2RUY9_9FIRM|nr:N-acetylmuramoyl-L-alanine amidase [Heliophilum fasciatum]TCP68192.1 N-acetylmuramoyl-L-alanine amidase [Heliophilum fasciatum]
MTIVTKSRIKMISLLLALLLFPWPAGAPQRSLSYEEFLKIFEADVAHGQALGVGYPRSYDVWMLARCITGEARGESYVGQVAVGGVVLNRVRHRSFPNTVAGVIFQPGAFTAVDDGQIWLNIDQTSLKAARDALAGWDPSGGALYYFNPATATSRWIWSRPQIKQIGRHIFTK